VIGLLSIIAVGFLVGMRHATDPDHVIAVTTIVSSQSSVRKAALVGAVWGIGHSLTILCVGGAMILARWSIPEPFNNSLEWVVGLMLIFLGLWNMLSDGGQSHQHTHLSSPYAQEGCLNIWRTQVQHSHESPLRSSSSIRSIRLLRPFIVGVIHGLAGSAAVALLILSTIQNVRWALAYLLVFVCGTIMGMMLITSAIALPFTFTNPSIRMNRFLRLSSGVLSLGFGLMMVYQYRF
jgi:high-affinity nickel permease